MRQYWWKILCVVLLAYTVIGGMLLPVPARFILNETIRNLYYHVPMWFGMVLLLSGSVIYAVKFLSSGDLRDDIRSVEFANVGVLFSVLGLVTGMEWAQFTWGAAWSSDPKQLCAALCMLTYFAYFILRGGMKDEEKRARISAVYNIFAYALMFPLLFVLPRLVDSLHPGAGGNPGFKTYDLDSRMRLVFYPAIIGWFLLGLWLVTIKVRMRLLTFFQDGLDFDFNKK